MAASDKRNRECVRPSRTMRGLRGLIPARHVKRPSSISNWLVHDAARLTGTKSSPLLFSSSLGWARRHYEPDRPHTVLKNKSNWQRQEVKVVSNLARIDTTCRPFKVSYAKGMDRPTGKMLSSGYVAFAATAIDVVHHFLYRPQPVNRRYLAEHLPTGTGMDLMRNSRCPGESGRNHFAHAVEADACRTATDPESPVFKGQRGESDRRTVDLIASEKLGCPVRMASTMQRPDK